MLSSSISRVYFEGVSTQLSPGAEKYPNGAKYRTRYGDDNLILAEQNSPGNNHLCGYDVFGNRYGTTTYEYSPTGHLQKVVYADGRDGQLAEKYKGTGKWWDSRQNRSTINKRKKI